jgi:hypothetical protein
MSEERGCLGRALRIGCGFALYLLVTAGAVALYGLWTAPAEVPELTTEERATATSKARRRRAQLALETPVALLLPSTRTAMRV